MTTAVDGAGLLDAILRATPFVWAIMILLVLASVFSWAIIAKKKRQLDAASFLSLTRVCPSSFSLSQRE